MNENTNEYIPTENVLGHERKVSLQIGGTEFKFTATRSRIDQHLSDLNFSVDPNVNRKFLLKICDIGQQGLLMDLISSKENFTLIKEINDQIIPFFTENETIIGTPTLEFGVDRNINVSFITDDQELKFNFCFPREKYDQFTRKIKEDPSSAMIEIHDFLEDSISKEQLSDYRKIIFDQRNFTVQHKLFQVIKPFLLKNVTTVGTLKRL